MTNNMLPVLAALVVLSISLVQPASATEAIDQIDINLDREAIKTGEPLVISYTLPADFSGLTLQVRRTADCAVMTEIPDLVTVRGTYHQVWDSTEIPEGAYYVQIASVNPEDGLFEPVTRFTVDNSPPVIKCSLSGDKVEEGWFSGNVTVSLTSGDKISGVKAIEYSLDDSSWISTKGTFTIPFRATHQVYYRSTDMADNLAQGSAFIYFPPETVSLDYLYQAVTQIPETILNTPMASITATVTPPATPATDNEPSLDLAGTSPTLSGVDAPSWKESSDAPKNPQLWNLLGMTLVAISITLMVGCAVYILLFKGKM